MFDKILIANRGEIACRVIRTAHRLGYRTVAVFSDADGSALHVRQADEAVHIGAAPAADSYLNIEALLAAARKTGADAVHPGYGFLSERAEFADACAAAGLVFIGPPAAAMRAMGDKASAKRRMHEAGVPCAPGYLGDDQTDERFAAEATRLGLPLLVKAVAGGGGRGMRLVRELHALRDALAGARREATAAFGDGRLMLERLIENGRHIEVQVFADRHGNAVHLGERDCTAQRRRQKVIEESPSPVVTAALRQSLGRDAVAAALVVGYVGAGTVEFIVDAGLQHHFLEMNTRLQVEHPVTECVTGIDLVEWQLRIAQGQPLPLRQDQIRFTGHAIEARLYAEDPYDGFRPQTGRVAGWRPDAARVRVDHGIAAGDQVTPYYDPLLAKFIAHGHDRDDAVRRLVGALADAPLLGLRSNGRFLRDLLLHPDFAGARMTTTRIDEWAAEGAPLLQPPAVPETAWRIAAALLAPPAHHRSTSVAAFDLTLQCSGTTRRQRTPVGGVQLLSHDGHHLHCEVDGVRRHLVAVHDGPNLHLAIDGAVFSFGEPPASPQAASAADPRQARAAMAGTVVQIAVAAGDQVVAGQPLVCIEAMKIEMWLHAAGGGRVTAVHVKLRDAVPAGATLVELDTSDDEQR